MSEEEQKKLEDELAKCKEDVKWYKSEADHYGALAASLVKKTLLLERKYDRRFIYPEEYE